MRGVSSGIVRLLESLGLNGFPLFVTAVGVSIFLLVISYLIATHGWPQTKGKKGTE